MWDAGLTTRIRDRKHEEMMSFASRLDADPSRREVYVEIIDLLNRDLAVCDSLIETNGEDAPFSMPIESSEYLEALTEAELADEEAFDAFRILPDADTVVHEDEFSELIRATISDAVEEIVSIQRTRARQNEEVVNDLMEELKSCRERVEQLSGTLDYTRSELQASEDEILEMESRLVTTSDFNTALMADVQALKVKLSETVAERDAVKEDADSRVEEIQALIDRNRDMELKLHDLDGVNLQLEMASREHAALIAERDSRIEELQALLAKTEEASEAESAALREQLESVRSELAESRDAGDSRIKALEADLSKASDTLEAEKALRTAEFEALRKETDDALAKRDALIVELENQVSVDRAEFEEMKEKLHEVTNENSIVMAEKDELIAELDAQMKEKDTAYAAELESEREAFRQICEQMDALTDDHEQMVTEKDDTIEELRATLRRKESEFDATMVMKSEAMARDMDHIRQEMTEKVAAYNDLLAEMETMRQDNARILEERDARIRDLKRQALIDRQSAVVMEERISVLAARLNEYGDVPELKMDLSRTIMDNESLQIENEELKAAICQITDRVRALEEESISRNDDFNTEREENERLVKEMKRQILGYKGTIDILEDKVERLANKLEQASLSEVPVKVVEIPEESKAEEAPVEPPVEEVVPETVVEVEGIVEVEEVAEEVAEEPVAEEPAPERADFILDEKQRDVLDKVYQLKNEKIDFFVDMSFSGRFNPDACESVIDFLKVDISIIEALRGMDETDKASIEGAFSKIIEIIDGSSEPQHQKMYANSLTADQKFLEVSYNDILAAVEDIINTRYSSLGS